MIMRCLLLAAFAITIGPARAQNDSNPPAGTQNPAAQTQAAPGSDTQAQENQPAETENAPNEPMQPPPPVSGRAFPISFASQERSNYLSIGVMGGVAYVTNVLSAAGTAPVNDETYSIWPTLRVDRSTPRLHGTLSYAPGFQFYQNVTALNQNSQNASGSLDYYPSPHSALNLHDEFTKTSNIFSSPYSLTGGTVSGSPGVPFLVLAPYADQISNEGGGLFSYQSSPVTMVGFGGGATELDYPVTSEAAGLYNANSYSGNAFYDRRFSRREYLGATANYISITDYPLSGAAGQTDTVAILPFYTFNVRATVSFSLAAGPQHYSVSIPPAPMTSGWTPSILASAHVGSPRANFSVSYQRTVAAGGGLLGAFVTNTGSADIRVQLGHAWTLGGTGTYTDNKSLPGLGIAEEGGHTLTAAGSLRHDLTEHLSAEVGYDFLHQDYGGIPVIAAVPSSNRVYGTIQYQLRRPLGR